MKFRHIILVTTIIFLSYFVLYNEAKSDGEKLAKQLCDCYNEESERVDFEGVDPIKIPDLYIYIVPEEYPNFRSGFIASLMLNCPQHSNALINWRSIGKNEFPVDQPFDPLNQTN